MVYLCVLRAPEFSYMIADNVVYLTIADKSYPRKLAFSYLDELSKEFQTTYGAKVEGARKPYAFVGFGTSTFLSVFCHMNIFKKLTDFFLLAMNRHFHE